MAKAEHNLVHLGLGLFHRSHQAWYTQLLNDRGDAWSYFSFASNSKDVVDKLKAQNCRYSLLETAPGMHPKGSVVSSISNCGVSSDRNMFHSAISNPEVKCITITVSEAGYTSTRPDAAMPRLARALFSRYTQNAAPVTVMSCDNLPQNSRTAKFALLSAAAEIEDGFASWLDSEVSFLNTVVDRVTTKPTDELTQTLFDETDFQDAAPVLTEFFSEWVIEGQGMSDIPDWQKVGAKIVDDLTVYEHRKLWLLNGAHSLMAYLGLANNLHTVREFTEHPLWDFVEKMWLEVGEALPIEGYSDYTQNLRRRFANPHMDHQLAKIATNGPAKLRSRCLPVMVLRAKEKRLASPVLAMQLAGWLLYLERADPTTLDPESLEFQNQLSGAGEEGLGDLIFRLDEAAANIDLVLESVREAYDQAKKGQIN